MKINAVICELNPLHKGHKALFNAANENHSALVTAIMSGEFVQRGDCAIISKWARTKMALLNGADIIIENPVLWSCAGAERFALGAVYLAEQMGVDELWFGSECGQTEPLTQIADCLLSQKFSTIIKEQVENGITFAKARQNAINIICGKKLSDLLSSPNNILGIEYIKACMRLNNNIKPRTIKRLGSAHDSNEISEYMSATSIRNELENSSSWKMMIPENCIEIINQELKKGCAPSTLKNAERAILYSLRTITYDELNSLPDISEGIQNRLYSAVKQSKSYDELLNIIKTKRYSLARIRRLIISSFLKLNEHDCKNLPPYARILGMNKSGISILKQAKGISKIPFITHSSDYLYLDTFGKKVFDKETLAENLYSLCMPQIGKCGENLSKGIIIQK